MRVLCALGEYLYGDRQRGQGVEYAAFIPALKRLGHEVSHFESHDRAKYPSFSHLNLALLAEVDRLRPHVLLAVQMNYEIWTETLAVLRARGDVATVCWTTDDSWKYRECSRFLAAYYHGMTTTYADIVARYKRDGAPNVLLTQWAVSSDWLNAPLPAACCRYQVSFVGEARGDRVRQIKRLQQVGIDVACFGHGWASGAAPVSELPRIMRESVISLGFSNVPAFKSGPKQVKARTFEVPGSGGFLLSEYAPGVERAYREGHEIAIFRDERELGEKVRYYLDHPEERDSMARAAHERTRNEHTYEQRMEEVLRFALDSQAQSRKTPSTQQSRPIELLAAEHREGLALKTLRQTLVAFGRLIFGARRGPRAARRLVFELSWRLAGTHTFSSRGWPGRMFPKDNG